MLRAPILRSRRTLAVRSARMLLEVGEQGRRCVPCHLI